MTQHDYKKALAIVNNIHRDDGDGGFYVSGFLKEEEFNAILHALRIAEKLSANLSQDIIQAGINSYNQNGHLAIVSHYKAMRDQMLKEIE